MPDHNALILCDRPRHQGQRLRSVQSLYLLTLVAILSAPSSFVSAQEENTSLRGLVGNQSGDDAPLYVKSDSLRLDAKSRVFIYDKNVEIVRGDVRITCDSMKGTYGEDSRLKTILCSDNVVITRAQELRASANRAHYDVERSIIVLTEGPELARDGNLLSADKITIFVNEDRSEAEGNVRVKVIKTEATPIAPQSGLSAVASSAAEPIAEGAAQ